jgi:hypothetical protein
MIRPNIKVSNKPPIFRFPIGIFKFHISIIQQAEFADKRTSKFPPFQPLFHLKKPNFGVFNPNVRVKNLDELLKDQLILFKDQLVLLKDQLVLLKDQHVLSKD